MWQDAAAEIIHLNVANQEQKARQRPRDTQSMLATHGPTRAAQATSQTVESGVQNVRILSSRALVKEQATAPIPRAAVTTPAAAAAMAVGSTFGRRAALPAPQPWPVMLEARHHSTPNIMCHKSLYIVPRTGVADTCQTHYGQTGPTLHA
jgi:hypothetical protein